MVNSVDIYPWFILKERYGTKHVFFVFSILMFMLFTNARARNVIKEYNLDYKWYSSTWGFWKHIYFRVGIKLFNEFLWARALKCVTLKYQKCNFKMSWWFQIALIMSFFDGKVFSHSETCQSSLYKTIIIGNFYLFIIISNSCFFLTNIFSYLLKVIPEKKN